MARISLYTSDVSRGSDPGLAQQAIQASEGASRANAQGLQSLADGLKNLSQGMYAYSEAKKSLDDNLFVNDAKNAASQSAIESNDFAIKNPDARPDGSDLFSSFESEYDLSFENYTADLDDEKKEKARIIWENEKNESRQRLFQQQREMHGKYVSNKSDEIKNSIGLSAYQDPSTFGQGIVRMDAMYNEMNANGLINPSQSQSLKKMASEEIAIQSIQGEIQKRNFDGAKERLIAGDVSTFVSPENRIKLMDIIDREKLQAIDSDMKTQRFQQEKIELDKKNQSDIIFRKSLSELSVATDPKQKEAVYGKILNLRTAGLITDEQFRFTDSVIQNTKGNYNERLEFDYRDKILRSNGQFDSIQNEIVDSVNKGAVDAKTGSELLSNLNTRKTQIESDPVVKQRYSLAEGRLDAAFGKDSFFEPMDQPRKIAKQNATEHMFKKINEGIDPLDAASEGIRLFGKSVNAMPLIQGVDYRLQSDPNGLDAAKQQLMVRFKNGTMSKEDYAKAIKVWMQRSDAVKMQIELDQAAQPKAIEGQ